VGNQVTQVNQEVGTMLYHRETPPLKHGEESTQVIIMIVIININIIQWWGDCACNTINENSSVFSII